jgi:hypothetical protein
MGFIGRLLCWALNLSALGGALGVVVAEGWDFDGDGALTAHEALLVQFIPSGIVVPGGNIVPEHH